MPDGILFHSREDTDMNDTGTRYLFREIRQEEAEAAAEMEQICFPPHEACTRKNMISRVRKDPQMFIVAEDRATGKLCGMINGMPTDADTFSDDIFTGFDMYEKNGRRMFLAGVEVLPQYRHKKLAHAMMEAFLKREKEKGREQVLLTCLEEKIPFYESMGYRDCGLSGSTWGNETWHEMVIDLQEKKTC